ncbi:hypothetical protein JHK86_052178 [Glycine max]|nr:hypothetical protein JHK86_052178 [Glycine max]
MDQWVGLWKTRCFHLVSLSPTTDQGFNGNDGSNCTLRPSEQREAIASFFSLPEQNETRICRQYGRQWEAEPELHSIATKTPTLSSTESRYFPCQPICITRLQMIWVSSSWELTRCMA